MTYPTPKTIPCKPALQAVLGPIAETVKNAPVAPCAYDCISGPKPPQNRVQTQNRAISQPDDQQSRDKTRKITSLKRTPVRLMWWGQGTTPLWPRPATSRRRHPTSTRLFTPGCQGREENAIH